MRFIAATIVSALAAFASAYTQPDYSKPPQGNAIIKPGLNQQVPAGQPFTIEWEPTTQGPISLVLLRGPSTNVKPLYALAENIPNSGHFTWTPSTSLEPDVTHYGLLLVVEGTGQYQWSTQFGISNPNAPVSSSTTSATEAPASTTTAAVVVPGTSTTDLVPHTITTTICPPTTTAPAATATSATGVTSASVPVVPSSTAPASTLVSSSVPSSAPTGSSPSAPAFTGAADRKAISFGAVAVGVAAVLAF